MIFQIYYTRDPLKIEDVNILTDGNALSLYLSEQFEIKRQVVRYMINLGEINKSSHYYQYIKREICCYLIWQTQPNNI